MRILDDFKQRERMRKKERERDSELNWVIKIQQ